MANRSRKKKFNIEEIPGTEKLEDIIAEPLVRYINERAGRVIVKVAQDNERTLFEEEGFDFEKWRKKTRK